MLIGIIFLTVGLLYLLEIILPDFIVNYSLVWPLIVMVSGLYCMFKKRKIDVGSSIMIFVGLWWFLVNLDLIAGVYTKIFWPLLLMIIGTSIIVDTIKVRDKIKEFKINDKDGIFNYYGVFGGCQEKVKSSDFKGAIVYSVFGGCEIDLSDIEMKNDSEVLVYSVFGGSEIILPKNYNVEFNSTGIFGGNENQNKNDYKKSRKCIKVTCISVFGGTEVK